jgi:hypothetical protein
MNKVIKSKWMHIPIAILVFVLMPKSFPIIAFITIFVVFFIIFSILWRIVLSLLNDDNEKEEKE